MTISAEERSRINTENGRKGGPKTPEGKRRSAQNSFKHGLRAETLCLPNEDPAALQARLDEWHGFYQPRSPAEREFLNKAVLSLQQSDRLRRAQDATLSDRVRDAQFRWEEEREDEVAQLAARLEVDPASAVRKLKRSAAGCRWLLEKWEGLKEHLDEHGWWTSPTLLHEATRLFGMKPEDAGQDADVYMLRLMNLGVETEKNRAALIHMLKPDHIPDTIRESVQDKCPIPDYCRQHLADRLANEVGELTSLEEYLRTTIDEPSLAGAEDRALLLDDESGRLLHRYSVAADNSFHRAYQNFLKARAREEGLIDAAPEIALPNEPNLTVEAEPTPLPNEPKSISSMELTPSKTATFADEPAPATVAAQRSKSEPTVDSTVESVAPLPNEPNPALTARGNRAEIGISDAA